MSEQPKLGLTTAKQAVVAVLSGAAICALIVLGFEAAGSFPPVVPWSVPAVLVLGAVAVTGYSRVLPKRLEDHKASAQEAFVALGVGKAMIMTGAIFAGAHAVYVMRYIAFFEAPLPSARVIHGAVTMVAALLLAGAGMLLERACLAKPPGDDDESDGAAEPA